MKSIIEDPLYGDYQIINKFIIFPISLVYYDKGRKITEKRWCERVNILQSYQIKAFQYRAKWHNFYFVDKSKEAIKDLNKMLLSRNPKDVIMALGIIDWEDSYSEKLKKEIENNP